MVSQTTVIFSKIIILDNSQSMKMWSKELLLGCDPRTSQSIKRQRKKYPPTWIKRVRLDEPGGVGVMWEVDLAYKIKHVCWWPPWRDPAQSDAVYCGITTGRDYHRLNNDRSIAIVLHRVRSCASFQFSSSSPFINFIQ